jgi:hypothetical protein
MVVAKIPNMKFLDYTDELDVIQLDGIQRAKSSFRNYRKLPVRWSWQK